MAKRYVSILVMSLAVLAITGFSTLIVLDSMQYRAIKVDSDRDIDDTFNDLSQDGWYPQFVLNFENNTRLILERPRVEEERIFGLEYRADVVRRGREIDDKMNERAEDRWMPRFVFRTGALDQNWRIIFERDPDAETEELEYRALVLDEGRQIDDRFNQLAVDGWEPLFIVPSNEEHRMLFVRNPNDKSQKWRFMAKVTSRIKEIDDLYDEHGQEGWEPMFLIEDENERYRSLFMQPFDAPFDAMEFQARRIEEISEVEDKFNQYSADGWVPMFVIPDVTEVYEEFDDVDGEVEGEWVEETRWRMLFGRVSE